MVAMHLLSRLLIIEALSADDLRLHRDEGQDALKAALLRLNERVKARHNFRLEAQQFAVQLVDRAFELVGIVLYALGLQTIVCQV